jgi:hypothetical protein
MSRPLRLLLCASAAALIFGSEPSAFLAAQAQVSDVAAPLPKFRGTHQARAFHRAPIGAPYNGGIGAPSRVGGKARNGGVDATSAIGGIGGASDVGGPALNGGLISGPARVGGPALGGLQFRGAPGLGIPH